MIETKVGDFVFSFCDKFIKCIGASTMSGIGFVVGFYLSKEEEGLNNGHGRSISETDNGTFKEA